MAPRRPTPVNVYQDKQTGVSFQYPFLWKRVEDPGGVFGSSVFVAPGVPGSGVPLRAAVQFSAERTAYGRTTLESLGFLYGILPRATTSSCRKVVTDVDPDARTRTVRGIVYAYGKGGDAGMSQSLGSQIYSTLRESTCFVFEADFNQTNGVVRDGQREMTAAERRSLQAQLDHVIVTVQFSTAKAGVGQVQGSGRCASMHVRSQNLRVANAAANEITAEQDLKTMQ